MIDVWHALQHAKNLWDEQPKGSNPGGLGPSVLSVYWRRAFGGCQSGVARDTRGSWSMFHQQILKS